MAGISKAIRRTTIKGGPFYTRKAFAAAIAAADGIAGVTGTVVLGT